MIVVESGSGLNAAVAASEYGLKVAVIEKGPLGGTCLNRSCIPSKMLICSADVLEAINRAYLFGIKVKGYQVDFGAIVDRVIHDIDSDSQRIERSLMKIRNPPLFKEQVKFVDYKTLQVGGERIRAEKILIACGNRPKISEIKGLRSSNFITSD
ncbi:MAG: FAD-dependent oxidoreductase [Nitrososphaeria archaeon]